MKKFLVGGLILVSLMSLAGCSETNEIKDGKLTPVESSIYDDYKNSISEVEEILTSHNLSYENVKTTFTSTSFSECEALHYFSDSGEGISDLDYSLVIDSITDTIIGYRFFISMYIDDSFDLNSTPIPDVVELFSEGKKKFISDNDAIKSIINRSKESEFITSNVVEDGNLREEVYVEDNLLSYSLTINLVE